MKPKLLLVEDNPDIQFLISNQLKVLNIETTICGNGDQAIELIHKEQFDLFILDRMLPGKSGLEICKILRTLTKNIYSPILMVTAMSDSEQIIEGLNSGADDYITKPFNNEILLARVRSQIRRLQMLSNEKSTLRKLEYDQMKLELDAHRFFLEDKEVLLTKSEFVLLEALIRNVGKVMSRNELKTKIQGSESVFVTDRTIDTHIFGLRKKLSHYAYQVESIRGIGYRINDQK